MKNNPHTIAHIIMLVIEKDNSLITLNPVNNEPAAKDEIPTAPSGKVLPIIYF